MTPEQSLIYWIREREFIRRRKGKGLPKPWTQDPILQEYKFCNVRRMDDRVSEWLLSNWYEPYYNHPNMLLACLLARQFNKIETLQLIGFPEKWNPKKLEKVLRREKEEGLRLFSAAYMITGTISNCKIDQVINRVATPIHEASKGKYKKELNDFTSLESLICNLKPFAGMGSFIAGQVVSDLRWAVRGSWKDRHTWAPMGTGSSRGVCRLLGLDVKHRIHRDTFEKGFQKAKKVVKKKLPRIYQRLEAIDIQNCLCEFDKYERTRLGEGRPKQKYPGAS